MQISVIPRPLTCSVRPIHGSGQLKGHAMLESEGLCVQHIGAYSDVFHRPPLFMGDLFQDPQWMPATTDSTKPSMYCICTLHIPVSNEVDEFSTERDEQQ